MLFVTVLLRSRSMGKADVATSAPCSQSPGKFSQKSIDTLDIEVLAERNQERAYRLESILNAGTSPAFCEDPQDIVHKFLEDVSHRQLQQSLPVTSIPPNVFVLRQNSETSLNCETTFQSVPSSVP